MAKKPPVLTAGAKKVITDAVDLMYDNILHRFLERPVRNRKQIIFTTHTPAVTFPDLFNTASKEERNIPDQKLLSSLLDIIEGYVEAQRHQTKTQAVHAVQSWLTEAHSKGVKTDVETVLGGELAELFGKTTSNIKRIIETESNTIKNTGTLDAIVKVNVANNIEDPVVAWIGPIDNDTCEDCKRIFLLNDGITPKVYYLSEATSGYYKKGSDSPAIGGLHPHCRHTIITVLPGYGFVGGRLEFIEDGYSEIDSQRAQVTE